MTNKPPRSTPEEIAEDIEALKLELAQRYNDPEAWKRYPGDSFAEIGAFYGEKEMKRRDRLLKAGINPFTGGPFEP